MKKKRYVFNIIFLVTICTFFISGCSTSSDNMQYTQTPTDEHARIYDDERGKNRYISTLPYDMDYNGNTIVFDSVELFQGPSSSGYGYNIYAVATIDVTNLDEKDLYWLDQDYGQPYGTFEIYAFITDESKKLDLETMKLSHTLYGEKRKYVFTLQNEYKQSFDNAAVTILISIKQDELYNFKLDDGKEGELNKHNEYKFTAEAKGGSELKDITSMDKDLLQYISN